MMERNLVGELGRLLAVPALSLGVACASDSGSSDEHASGGAHHGGGSGGAESGGAAGEDPVNEVCDGAGDVYEAGLSATGRAGYTVTLTSAEPAPPALNNNRWTVELTDEAGNLVEGALLTADPEMPAHGHGTPVDVIVEDLGGGTYTLDPVNLFMGGLWVVTIDVEADGDTDTIAFSFCIY